MTFFIYQTHIKRTKRRTGCYAEGKDTSDTTASLDNIRFNSSQLEICEVEGDNVARQELDACPVRHELSASPRTERHELEGSRGF